ncbi:MAG: hypothetical protein V8Q76_08600 [Bacteroides intestinalis]
MASGIASGKLRIPVRPLAYVTSPDLQKWEAQSYFSPEERSKYEPKDVYPTTQKKVLVK